MYLFNITIKDSKIQGKGVFVLESIPKGSVVWKFYPGKDKSMTQNEFESLAEENKRTIEKVGYLSPISGIWIYPAENDLARYTNHSINNSNLSASINEGISSEIFFIANRNINKDEELLVNYLEFDEFIKNTKPNWI